MRTFEIDTTLTGRGILIVESEKSPDEFDSLEDFMRQANFIEDEVLETDVDNFDSWSEITDEEE